VERCCLNRDRGAALLVGKGNPLGIQGLTDIARTSARIALANTAEEAARARYHLSQTNQASRNSSGSFAIFAAILRASSLLSSLAAERRPGSSSK
jgi:hypothetical protein